MNEEFLDSSLFARAQQMEQRMIGMSYTRYADVYPARPEFHVRKRGVVKDYPLTVWMNALVRHSILSEFRKGLSRPT